jgi:hypothetical protein
MPKKNTGEWYVYELFVVGYRDEVEYVGKTGDVLTRRDGHVRGATTKPHTRDYKTNKAAWIREVLAAGGEIGVEAISSWIYEKHALTEEKRVIKYYRSQGRPLKNMSSGGAGTSGIKHSVESRQARSVAMQGNTRGSGNKNRVMDDEWVEKIAAAKRGRTYRFAPRPNSKGKAKSEKTLAALKAGRETSRTLESRAKQSRAMKGKPWTEARRHASLQGNYPAASAAARAWR